MDVGISGTGPDGERWGLSREEALRAARRGTIYFVTFEAESHMVRPESFADPDASMLLAAAGVPRALMSCLGLG